MLRPNAYHFRDYVVKAWNEDRPYDRFILEQLAGDALGVDAATGFLVGGACDRVKSPDIKLTLMQRQNELADMIDTTGTAFLGLTTGCARCHDHKFDPILQTDYYALQAVFAGVQHGERELGGPLSEQRSKRLEQLRDQITEAVVARQQMGIRPPVNAHQNEERFDPVVARFVRFTIPTRKMRASMNWRSIPLDRTACHVEMLLWPAPVRWLRLQTYPTCMKIKKFATAVVSTG